MIFKNLVPFQMIGDSININEVEIELYDRKAEKIGANQRESIGWVSPLGRKHEGLALIGQGHMLICMETQTRKLPASTVNDALNEKIDEIIEQEGRKVSGKEKKDLREQIEFEMLPGAPITKSNNWLWIDTDSSMLYVDAATIKKAEEVTGLLRKTIGSLPLVPLETNSQPATVMSNMVRNPLFAGNGFMAGTNCVFSSTEDKSKITVKDRVLESEEIHQHLDEGLYASQLQVIWEDKIEFTLTDALTIKQIKFLDYYEEKLSQESTETQEDKMDVEFTLARSDLSELVKCLIKSLGGVHVEQVKSAA